MMNKPGNGVSFVQRRLVFPEAAAFNRIVAKDKILKQNTAPLGVKKMFQAQIERIRCSYELTSEKLNLKSSSDVPKILIIQIFLKRDVVSSKVLEMIDRAFGVPVFFELHYADKFRYCASYRRRSRSDPSTWVLSGYFTGSWLEKNVEATPLPVTLSLDSLYRTLLKAMIPLPFRKGEALGALVSRVDRLRVKERDAERLESRMKKEKQFNRKVELNRKLNELKQEIEDLSK